MHCTSMSLFYLHGCTNQSWVSKGTGGKELGALFCPQGSRAELVIRRKQLQNGGNCPISLIHLGRLLVCPLVMCSRNGLGEIAGVFSY